MAKIVAVGGGSIGSMDAFFMKVVELCSRTCPHVTVIPTGAGDAERELASFDLWRVRLGLVAESVSPLFFTRGIPVRHWVCRQTRMPCGCRVAMPVFF